MLEEFFDVQWHSFPVLCGCFGVVIEWFWGVSSEMYFTNRVKAAERDKFSNLERVLRYFTLKLMHCLHGLEELVSNDVTRVEIPPLHARLHRLDT